MALRWTAVVLLVAAAAWAHTHSHEGGGHHAHSHEPAHHKYSREANEAAAQEQAWEEEEELYHGHAHDHGHSHDDHGHSHEGGECPHAAAARKAAAQKQAEAQKQAHAGHGDRGHSHEGGECPHAAAAKKAAAQKQAEAQKQAHAGHSDHGHSHEGGECPHAAAAKKAAEQKKAASKALHAEGAGYTGALSFMNDARTRLWVHAIGATLLISFAPFVILFFIPITSNTEESGPLLKVLLAFGAGGLLGDAFLHLIPHATPAGEAGGHAHSHSHGHSHGEGGHGGHDMSVGGWVLAGIISFLIVEKLVRILRGEEAGHGHSHGHSHGGAAKAKQSDDEDDKKKKDKKEAKKQEQREIKQSGFKQEPVVHRDLHVAAYLNLVADFAHNFTDGLAIGASFLAGTTVGVVTMITVLVHEVPHEIGDFAILVQSGMSRKRAMMMQLVTAVGACAGCVLSLWSADGGALADAAASSWVLPFTAGGFIYIAAVSVIPELLDSSSSMWQSTKEIFFLLLGIFMMYLIAIYE